MKKSNSIKLYISKETRNIAVRKAEQLNISISALFKRLIKENNIINISDDTQTNVVNVYNKLNEIEQHLYSIKKSIFETIENNAGNITQVILNLKDDIDNCHQNINCQIQQINDLIFNVNCLIKGNI